ncbi:hypothetical protein CU084_06350 [Bacillus velezensis]|nr:hypothetical protein CU084_06350 [Bacillus velezensis]
MIIKKSCFLTEPAFFCVIKKPRRDKRGFICLNDNKGDGRNFSRSNKGVMFVCDQFHILIISNLVEF